MKHTQNIWENLILYRLVPPGTVSRYIDKNRTGACGLGRNRRLLRHTELVFLSTVCARRVVLVLFTNMDATIVVN